MTNVQEESGSRPLIAFGSVGAANAACTQDEATAKATTLSTQLAAYGQKDPAKFADLMTEYQKDATDMAAKADDMDAACAFYDSWIEKTK